MEEKENLETLDLNEIRKEIDRVDTDLVALFEKRMALTTKVAKYKVRTGKKVLDTEREKAKLAAISGLVTNEINKHGINEIFTEIMATSRKQQYMLLETMGQTAREDYVALEEVPKDRVKVVYQGVPGAYSWIAMRNYFGEAVENVNVRSFKDAIIMVEEGKVDYAVVPIENSTAGIVNNVYDLLADHKVYIIAETFVEVKHALLGVPGATMEDIQSVYSHVQALNQCRKFLEAHPHWKSYDKSNTAASAKMVAELNDPTIAAIASKEAAQFYGLSVLQEEINTEENNTTRFVILTNQRQFVKDAKKVSICFEAAHTSGSLYDMLSHIIYNGLNMTKIESRPIEGQAWEFRFFVDFDGNIDDPAVMNALRGIEEESLHIKLLGNY
ncbi:MAG: prephenate dehydratase [Lachnospiraceae bacterium]|nr:prephenate dehydratase [Lachnospiraceae bacterium]